MSEMTVMNSLTSDVLGKRPGPKLTVLKHGNGENPFNFRGNENTDSDIRRQVQRESSDTHTHTHTHAFSDQQMAAFKVIRKLHMQPGVQVSHSTVNKQGCQIKEGVYQLVSSLKDNSYLRKLDLRYNDLGDIGQEILQRERLSLRYTNFVALTFDPQTANDLLYLSENNTKVTRQREKQRLPANDERFDKCNQVLCRQPLIGRCFFIVDVIGRDVHVGVACKAMDRKGASDTVCLGHNKMSWSLHLSDNLYVAHHNNKTVSIQSESSVRNLGVFVNRDAGSVCFYMLSPQYKLLYVFDADFPEDQELYAAFRIQEPNSSVILRQESQ
ncbi:LRR and PYD domains-containing 12-like protein [Labeo rohita]|uniref:LRR and PYD domains-containing 12-like protein n=1 Tax=Labeo rohita TaxID=84645 RepID=A0A498M2J2_LABRO|nr:LRR and PYD domains-containing 12-like protein [Labeo rohita]